MRVFKNGAPASEGYILDLREGDGISLTVADEPGTGASAVTISNGGSSPLIADYGPAPNGKLGPITRLDPTTARAANAPGAMNTPTPDGSKQVVEPCVLYFPEKKFGHYFWMMVSGYNGGSATYENPLLLCCDTWPDPSSAASQSWAVPAGVTNPLVAAPSGAPTNHNSDASMAYDPVTDTFVVTYLVITGTTQWDLYYFRIHGDANGITTIDAPTHLKGGSQGGSIPNSPCLWYDERAGLWRLWMVSVLTGVTNKIFQYTADTVDNLGPAPATVNSVTGVPGGRNLWEMQVTRIGDLWVAPITTATNLQGANTQLHLMTSRDGNTWTFSTAPFLTAGPSGAWDSNQIYRCGIVPLDNRGGERLLGCWYSAVNASSVWKLGYTEIRVGPGYAQDGVVSQALVSAGAVRFDAGAGGTQIVTLSANATSSSIVNIATNQFITIHVVQDSTGGYTFSWPANVKWAGGSAPSNTTANKRDVVTFYYDGTNLWEQSRAASVG